MMRCRICREPLAFITGTGYLHSSNHKAYIEKEVACHNPRVGRTCPGDESCRRCRGSGKIMVDDHCVQPVNED